MMAAAIVCCAGVWAAGRVEELPKQYLIPKREGPIRIDGRLDEWDMGESPYDITPEVQDALHSVHSNDATNPVKGTSDLSGKAALAWDAENLYVAGRMVDDHLRGVKPDSAGNQGPAGWKCDSLMLAIASFRQPMRSNTPYSRTPFLNLRYAPPGPEARGKPAASERDLNKRDQHWKLTRNSGWAVTETKNGYNVEASIPWADLDFVPRPGEKLFCAFLAADVDPGESLNQVGWGFEGGTKNHPMFRLSEDGILGCLTISRDEVPLEESWAVRAELDALRGSAKLAGVRVVDEDGRTVAGKSVGLPVPEGHRGVQVVEFGPNVLSTRGDYILEELAEVGGEGASVVTRVPLKVVKAQPEPPVVKNPEGEIHHMGPDRVAHNAYDEHRRNFYRHGFVRDKEDYVPFIRRHVMGRVKAGMRRGIKSKNRYLYRDVLWGLALYRITDDEEYAELVREGLEVVLDQVQKNGNDRALRGLATIRYFTWMKDPDTHLAPENAEDRYLAAYHYLAANPPKHLFTEWGTHNRCWHRYIPQRIAMEEARKAGRPVDDRIPPYVKWHTERIWKMGDTSDNSAGYHWVFFRYVWQYFMHTGQWDEFLEHPEFMKTIRRYVEMVAPGGACPQFGSTSGWPSVGMSMLAYEWISTISGDGTFKWRSHRIAEYYYNHLDHDRFQQYHLPADTARTNFLQAYLLADDSVEPEAPSAQSRITWRRGLIRTPPERHRERPGLPRHTMVDEQVPDKLLLWSGREAQDLWGMVELVGIGGHSGQIPGAIHALMQHDAALLAGQGYYGNSPEFQNILWVEDLEGVAADSRPLQVSVPAFVEDRALTYARIRSEPYQKLPVTYTRDLLFVKNGFVVVKDRAKFHSTMKTRVGPCYQTRCLGPQTGENWFNTYYDQLYYTGLGLGKGVQAIRNPSWDLLIYFTERPDRKHTVLDRYSDNPYRCSPIQIRQVWSGMARAGEELTFTSVLLPHTPSFQPRHFLQPSEDSGDRPRIEVVRDDDNVTVLRAISETDPQHNIRRATWIMFNETGETVEAGPLASDGRVAVVGHDRRGEIRHRVLIDGNVLRYEGKDLSDAARTHAAKPWLVPEKR